MLKRLIVSFVLVFVGTYACVTVPVQAALTNDQVEAILNLLRSFNAEASVVANVEASLRGTTLSSCPELTQSLFRGVTDETSNGEVSFVQTLLAVEPVSGYFGPITEKAVQDFQTARGIVAYGTPETTGFGVVGPLTRAALRDACFAKLPSESSGSTTSQTQTSQIPQTTTTPSQSQTTTSSGQSVNDLIYAEAVASGLPGDKLQEVKDLLDSIGTTTPEAAQNSSGSGGDSSGSAAGAAVAAALAPYIQNIISQIVSGAFVGGKNFGTPHVLFNINCNCSNTQLVYMQPTGPDNVKALSYIRGTQQYESFNVPQIGQALVGKYTPIGICWIQAGSSCVSIQNDGMMTGVLGSSPK